MRRIKDWVMGMAVGYLLSFMTTYSVREAKRTTTKEYKANTRRDIYYADDDDDDGDREYPKGVVKDNENDNDDNGKENAAVVVKPTRTPKEHYTCAPWIPTEKRKILMNSMLHRFVTWEDHADGLSNHIEGYIKGGEPYWSACVHRALTDLGFEVEITNNQTVRLGLNGKEMQALIRGDIHRLVTDTTAGGNFFGTDIWSQPDILCKVRMMEWWPAEKRPQNEFTISPIRQDEVSTTSAHFVPFFVHATLTDPPIQEMIPRNRRAIFVYEKTCNFLDPDILRALHDAGFELYFQCWKKPFESKGLEDIAGNFTHIDGLFSTPREYATQILQKVAIVLGYGIPMDSPTAIEALYNGAAFLNPEYDPPFEGLQFHPRTHMHHGLKNLGPPYVYNYNANYLHTRRDFHVKNYENKDFDWKEQKETMINSILEAAERAAAQPFISYTPADYSYESVKAHVCANIIEYDPCWIPGQT